MDQNPPCAKLFWEVFGVFLLSCLVAIPVWADETAIQSLFYPYRQASPRIPGLEPGVTLTKENARLAREVLPPELLQLLAEGEFAITIQATTDLPPRQSYLDATVKYASGVSLNGGTLDNYQAGVPFPLLDPSDPQAGIKNILTPSASAASFLISRRTPLYSS